jgi:ribonuclease III
MHDFSPLEKKLGLKFKNENLLIQAFCHRSYLNEHPSFRLGNNERMEFLGDAVIELAVSDYLYNYYPDKGEGLLTSWRSALVNSKILAKASKEAGFDKFLLLSRGEKKETGKARQEILANTFESFLGAFYLDQGFAPCQKFIERHLLARLPDIIENQKFVDAKSYFQELAQEREKITPNYKILEEAGPDHAKQFVSGVFLGSELVAKGKGASKQESEEQAAENGIKAKKWERKKDFNE